MGKLFYPYALFAGLLNRNSINRARLALPAAQPERRMNDE